MFNYDETNVTDDPGSKQVIICCGRNRVERKVHRSKSSVSVMFAGSADGTYLHLWQYTSPKTFIVNMGVWGP